MNITEARNILGIGPGDEPCRAPEQFAPARERLAEMVRSAPNERLALRFQEELVEFDRALAALREHAEMLDTTAAATAAADTADGGTCDGADAAAATPGPVPPARPAGRWLAWSALWLLLAVAAGAWFYLKWDDDRRLRLQSRIIELERQGAALIDDRRWPEAEQAFLAIERLRPGAEAARVGLRSIEAGITEERNQFAGYWIGEARAAMEAALWDEADAAVGKVLDRLPEESEALRLQRQIADARIAATLAAPLQAARSLLAQGAWDAAISAARAILANHPQDPDAGAVVAEATAGRERMIADLAAARELLALAVAADRGEFDGQALDWLREAAALAPQDEEIAAKLEQMASYVRTLRVPEEFETPAEALAVARENDRIVIAEGEWPGPLLVDLAVDLQGASAAATVFSCEADAGSAITFGPGARGARVGGITFRHLAFDPGPERYSAVLIRGAEVTFADCRFIDASGHGLLVIEGGRASVGRCQFSANGWNGAAATGEASVLDMHDCEVAGNFGHGVEAWDGASLVLHRNRITGNSGNGVHAGDATVSAAIESNQFLANREFGLVLGAVAAGRVAGNVARGNLLGGLVIHASASAVAVTGNQAADNGGPGLILERGLSATDFTANRATGNKGSQVLADANLSPAEPGPAEDPERE
jgi:nitrous oxidase accessory protein NosD